MANETNEQTPAPPTTEDVFTAADDKPQTQALATTDSTHTFEPQSLGQAFRVAKMLVASGLLPKTIRTPAAAMAIIMKGRELGLTTMQSVQAMHVIEGKVCMSADLMVAIAKRSPRCKYFKMVESTNDKCVCETWREGDPDPTRMTFTLDDAKVAALLGKDNWKHYPAAMLRARCKSGLARAVYEQELTGLVTPDEATDDFITVEAQPVSSSPAKSPEERAAAKTEAVADQIAAQLARSKGEVAALEKS